MRLLMKKYLRKAVMMCGLARIFGTGSDLVFNGLVDGSLSTIGNWFESNGVTPHLSLPTSLDTVYLDSSSTDGSCTCLEFHTDDPTNGFSGSSVSGTGTITCSGGFFCGGGNGGETVSISAIVGPVSLANNSSQPTLSGCAITGNVGGTGNVQNNTISGTASLSDGTQNIQCMGNVIAGLSTITNQSGQVTGNTFNGGLTTDNNTLETSISSGESILSVNTISGPVTITGYACGTLVNPAVVTVATTAAAAAQLVTDQAAVNANKAFILAPASGGPANTLGVVGTYKPKAGGGLYFLEGML